MSNLFTNVNLNTAKTVASTFDLKLLDTVCNHQVLNEQLIFNANVIFNSPVYSGDSSYADSSVYNGGIDPNAFVYVTTSMPLGNLSVQFFELPNSDTSNPIQETFIVPSGASATVLNQTFTLSFPPVPNTTSAELVTTSTDEFGDVNTIFFPFNDYTLSQLFGNIQFNSIYDMGSQVQFSYIGDIRQIFPKAKDYSTNWEFVGYNQQGQGVFRIYGRSFLATGSQLIIRYYTLTQACPRCGGTNLINDLDFNTTKNQYYLVYDFSKMIQDFFKRFLTARGSDIFDASVGTQVPLFIGLGKNNPNLIDTLIRTEVINLVNVIRNKQSVQLPVQGLSLAEQIGQVNQLTVTLVNITDVNLIIDMQSLSNTTAQIQTTVGGNT